MEHLVSYFDYDDEGYSIELYRQSVKLYKGYNLLYRKYIDNEDNKVTAYYTENKSRIDRILKYGLDNIFDLTKTVLWEIVV